MRKYLLLVLALLLCLICVTAVADTEYTLDRISAKLSLSDSYIVLTPDNLSEHLELLERLEKTKEVVEADFAERGVCLQAWVPDLDACLEITVVEDEDSKSYYDIEQQTNQARTAYKASHLKGEKYKEQGYSIKSAEWKKQTKGGRFLMLKYKRTVNGYVYWGYARRTIRNGYTLTLDYQVYNRGLRSKDLNSLNKVANTVEFTNVSSIPESTEGLLEFTSTPPAETNTGTFTVEGRCTPEAHLIGVIMRMSSPTPTRIEATAKKNGTFKMNVTLPEEGIWLMTLTIEVGDTVIAEEIFDTTTFNKSFIPVSLESDIPEELPGDELVISGKTAKAVYVQCIVLNGTSTYDKTVRTNGTGKFSFKVPTSLQADYDITLVFSKKNYETRRFTYTSKRTLTEEDERRAIRDQAIKPAYATLLKKLEGYTGRIMGYQVYITDIQKSGDEWIIFGALNKTKKGYKDTIVVTCDEEPAFIVDSQQKMYGTCTGAYQVQSEEDTVTYPSFDLLFWDTVK